METRATVAEEKCREAEAMSEERQLQHEQSLLEIKQEHADKIAVLEATYEEEAANWITEANKHAGQADAETKRCVNKAMDDAKEGQL